MKKILSILLIAVMLLLLCITPAFAENNEEKIKPQLQEVLSYLRDKDKVKVILKITDSLNEEADLEIHRLVFEELGYTLENAVDENAKVLYTQRYNALLREYYGTVTESIIEELSISEYVKSYSENSLYLNIPKSKIYEIITSEYVLSVGLWGSYKLPDPNNLYELDFRAEFGMTEEYSYKEVYYHKNDAGEIEWCLVSVVNINTEPFNYYTVLSEYVILRGCDSPFTTQLGLYDPADEKFYDIVDIEDYSKYDEFFEQLLKYEYDMYPIGDADLDKKLTVMDATFIQRVAAQLCEYDGEYDDLRTRFNGGYEYLAYLSDFNRDYERSVMDATAIQRHLAGLE